MRTPEWLDVEDAGDAPGRRRPTLLIVAAIAPWFLVVGVLVSGVGGAGDGEMEASEHVGVSTRPPAEPHREEARQVPPIASGSTGDDQRANPAPPDASDTQVGVRLLPIDAAAIDDVAIEEASALSVAVGHAWLADENVAQIVPESIRRTSAHSLVATVLVVLDADGSVGEFHRIAVPLATTENGIAPTATPFPLPPPDVEPVDPPLRAVDDEDLVVQVSETLHAAGLDDLEVAGLYTAEGWPLLADVRGVDGGVRPMVWLTDDDGTPVVAGHVASSSRTPQMEPFDASGAEEVAP